MSGRVTSRSGAFVALLVSALLGLACPDSGGVTVRLVPSATSVPAGAFFTVDVVVDTGFQPVQAFELSVLFDPALIVATGTVDPDPGFDDDGSLLVAPVLNLAAGTLGPIVDLRHGPSAAGAFVAATLHFQAVAGTGTGWVFIADGGLASPSGQPIQVKWSGSAALVALTP